MVGEVRARAVKVAPVDFVSSDRCRRNFPINFTAMSTFDAVASSLSSVAPSINRGSPDLAAHPRHTCAYVSEFVYVLLQES